MVASSPTPPSRPEVVLQFSNHGPARPFLKHRMTATADLAQLLRMARPSSAMPQTQPARQPAWISSASFACNKSRRAQRSDGVRNNCELFDPARGFERSRRVHSISSPVGGVSHPRRQRSQCYRFSCSLGQLGSLQETRHPPRH